MRAIDCPYCAIILTDSCDENLLVAFHKHMTEYHPELATVDEQLVQYVMDVGQDFDDMGVQF
jgi:hypothetical protein